MHLQDRSCVSVGIFLKLHATFRSWNIRFDEVIKAYGFIQTYDEACIYKKVSGSSLAFLILYVHGILLIGNDIEFLDSIKGYLKRVLQRKTSVKLLTH